MKTLFVGIVLAIGLTFATQAFAIPYCPNHGPYNCIDYEQ